MIPEDKLFLENISKDVLAVASHIHCVIYLLSSYLHSICLVTGPCLVLQRAIV